MLCLVPALDEIIGNLLAVTVCHLLLSTHQTERLGEAVQSFRQQVPGMFHSPRSPGASRE
jgi:hypothetical protein